MSGTDDKDLELDPLDLLEFETPGATSKEQNQAEKQTESQQFDLSLEGGLDLGDDLNLTATSNEESTRILKTTESTSPGESGPPELDELTMSTRVLDLPDLGELSPSKETAETALPDLHDQGTGATRVENLDDLKQQLNLDKTDNTAFTQNAMTRLQEIDSLLEEDRQTSLTNLSELGLEIDSSVGENSYQTPQKRESTQTKTKFSFRDSDDVDLSALVPEAQKIEQVTRDYLEEPVSQKMRNDLAEVKGHYGTELERLHATLTHLKQDRQELLKRIDEFEKEKMQHQRQMLSVRADLDEKKVELTIYRKKMSTELEDLKLKVQILEEKKMLSDEKVKLLQQELEKYQQGIKLDHKKISARERELEQKLELLKSDAETQIMHRDKIILDLKRKIDGMEFDMDNISNKEKKSLASKADLETKLDKAIRTLRSAITILESEESSKTPLLDKLKKNLDM